MPKSKTIAQLSRIETTDVTSDGVTFLVQGNDEAMQMSMGSLVDNIKKSLGYLERPLIKCRHCGQWGAAYCACRHCGAPIDPS